MSYFQTPARWKITGSAFRQSLAEMAIDGAFGREGIAMWLGSYEGDTAVVTHVAVLRGPGVYKTPVQLRISDRLMNDIADLAIDHRLTLIGQIHSHGPTFGTFLSDTDKRYGIAVPGYLSAVAPDYAIRPNTRIGECGFHIFENGRGWHRLAASEAADRIQVVPSPPVPVLIAGKD